MRAVIFTGGRLQPGKFVDEALAAADMVIAADSGAKTALAFSQLPSAVIGDFDSLDKITSRLLKTKGVRFITHGKDKDQTDTELAITYAAANGATEITVLGGIDGDRLDHVLANVFLMIGAKIPVRFVNGSLAAWVVKGPAIANVTGATGNRLSLIPLTPRVTELKTAGLRYPLRDETLRMNRARGVSNVITQERASVSWSRGTMLFVQSV